jgi:hypothetical protein
MAGPRKKAVRKTPVTLPATGPTDEPGQQPTPDSDALGEAEGSSSGVGLSLADIASALRAAGTSASREQLDRAFTRDNFDVDIGLHEGMRWLILDRFSSLNAMNSVLDHAKAVKALNNEETQHERNSDNAFYSGVSKSDSTFHSGLLKAYGLETDNEVLSTVALAKIVDNLAQKVDAIMGAISQAKQ